MPKFNLAQFEAVDGLLDQLLRVGDFMTCADPRGYVRLSSRLLDACLDAGMTHDQPDHHEWALEYVTAARLAA